MQSMQQENIGVITLTFTLKMIIIALRAALSKGLEYIGVYLGYLHQFQSAADLV